MRFLIAARSSLHTYTARASSMKSRSKLCLASLSRMRSSMSHSRSLTSCSARTSAASSCASRPQSRQVCSSSASSSFTLASFAASGMRTCLILRMVILSSSSPGEMGTRMSFMDVIPWGPGESGYAHDARGSALAQQLVESRGDLLDADQVHDTRLFDLVVPGQLAGLTAAKGARGRRIRERGVARGPPVAQRMPRARVDDERGLRVRNQPLGVGTRGRRQRQVPAQQPFGDAQCGEKAEKTVEYVLAAPGGDARVGEQPLQLAGPRTAATEVHGP